MDGVLVTDNMSAKGVRFWVEDPSVKGSHNMMPVFHEEYINWLEDKLCEALLTFSVAREGPREVTNLQDLIELSELIPELNPVIHTSLFRLTLWNSWLTRHS